MRCPICHSENNETSKFCSNCAAPLGQVGSDAASLTKTLETPVRVMKAGTVIASKYRIVEEIGQGGMGIVYKAEDLKLKRTVALKFLPLHLMNSPELRERFLVEAQAAAALSHPNICVIYEVGESGEHPYIAMEFVEGKTLREKLKKGPLPAAEAMALTSQVAAGLAEAHGKGIIHRDIKSANIMVTAKGQAKVMDFGLAKLQGGSSLTRSQTTLGTVAYMSPEQARAGELDARTDIWSLGVVLYEMLAGKMPFHGDHDQAVIYSILHDEPEALKKARPGLPAGLDEIVGQALAKKTSERYQTMEELQEDVEAVAEGLKPLRAKRRRPTRRILGIRMAYVYSALAVLAALALGLSVGGLRNRILGKASAAPAIRLAVLPFENLSGDPDQEPLNDQMTQEMIAKLGSLHPETLRVIARTSVMHYKKTNTPIDQIGHELNVGYVLEGSTQKEGTRIRITAALIKVRDQTPIWTDSIERENSGVLALQNEVSQNVAKALALKLLPSEQARLETAPAVNPEAYDACVWGSFYMGKWTSGGMDTAEKYFNLAIEKDPSYAPAYLGLAGVWLDRNQMGWSPPEIAGPKAKAAAQRAIELDEDSDHGVLAVIKMLMDWDWDGAWESWRRAIELDPVVEYNLTYAQFLMIMGHGEEALIHGKRGVELDPLNPLARGLYAAILYFQRRYDEAIAAAREALVLQPDFVIAWSLLSDVFPKKGMVKEALEAEKALCRLDVNAKRIEAALDEGYAQGGYAEAMKRTADVLIACLPETFYKPSDIAHYYAHAGEKSQALDWLEKGLEIHDPFMPYIGVTPSFDDIRSDPRFQNILRRVGLPTDANK